MVMQETGDARSSRDGFASPFSCFTQTSSNADPSTRYGMPIAETSGSLSPNAADRRDAIHLVSAFFWLFSQGEQETPDTGQTVTWRTQAGNLRDTLPYCTAAELPIKWPITAEAVIKTLPT